MANKNIIRIKNTYSNFKSTLIDGKLGFLTDIKGLFFRENDNKCVITPNYYTVADDTTVIKPAQVFGTVDASSYSINGAPLSLDDIANLNHSDLSNRDHDGNHSRISPSTDGVDAVRITDSADDNTIISIDTTNKRIGFGTTAPQSQIDSLVKSANNTTLLECFSTTDGHSAEIVFRKSSDVTRATTANGESLGRIIATGHNTAPNPAFGAQIEFKQTGASDVANLPTDIIFSTSDNVLSNVETMRISSDHKVGIGKTPSAKLDVLGNTSLDGSVVVNESGANVAFRVEGDTIANLITTVPVGDKVGIGTGSPSTRLHVLGDTTLQGSVSCSDGSFQSSGATSLLNTVSIYGNTLISEKSLRVTGAYPAGEFVVSIDGFVEINKGAISPDTLDKLKVNGNAKFTRAVEINNDMSTSGNLVVKGQTDSYLLTTNATDNQVIIGAGTGQAKLTVNSDLYCLSRKGVKKYLTDAVTTGLFEVALTAGTSCGGMFTYRIHCYNGTDIQSLSGIVNYAAVNKAGTITSSLGHSSGSSGLETEITTGGSTMSDTWSITTATNKITINLNADTSLTPSANEFYVIYSLNNDSERAITIL